MNSEESKNPLDELDEFDHETATKVPIGFPANLDFDLDLFFKWWSHSQASHTHLNDSGDPFTHGDYLLSNHKFECVVLEHFANIVHVDDFWGYVTTGGTLGNEQGLYIGRTQLEQFGDPLVYFSEDTHHSLQALTKLLKIERVVIPSLENGEINYQILDEKLQPERPVLMVLNIGTTFKGAIDDIHKIENIIKKKNISPVFYHADAALFGGFLPYLQDEKAPKLDFRKHPYDSIAISGHKFFGSPIPLGVYLTKHKYLEKMECEVVEYLNIHNTTIPCSRSALNSLILWYTLQTKNTEEYRHEAVTILDNAKYLYEQMRSHNYPVWLNTYSNIVYFKAPSEAICKEWGLPRIHCKHLGHLSHVVVMQHVTRELLDQFLHSFFCVEAPKK